MTALAKILLDDYMGYDVEIASSAVGSSSDGINRLATGAVHANIEVWPYEYSNVSKIESLGGNGLNGQKGWYIPKKVVESEYSTNGRIIDHWRAFKNKAVHKLFVPPSAAIQAAGKAHCLAAPDLSAGGTCANEGWYRPTSGNCNSGAATAANCASLLAHSNQPEDAATLRQLVDNLGSGLDMSILWLDDKSLKKQVSDMKAAEKPVLFYWWTPSVFVDPASYTRVHMPDCKTASSNKKDCDFPQQQLAVYVWPELHNIADAAHSFLKKMTVSNFQIQSIFDDANALATAGSSPTSEELETAACKWLNANKPKWSSWIPPPPVCTDDDYTFTTSACDGDHRTITFKWNHATASNPALPLNCKGGVGLPTSLDTECDIVNPKGFYGTFGVATCSMGIVLCVVCIIFIFMYRDHVCFSQTQPPLMLVMGFGCVLALIPTYLDVGSVTLFKCNAVDFLLQFSSDMIIGGYILKARHYTKTVSESESTKVNDKDIHKKIHAVGSVRKAKRGQEAGDVENARTVLTVDGRLIKEGEVDETEFRRQMITMSKILLIEILIFIAKFNFEARTPTFKQMKLSTSNGESVVMDYVVCESVGSLLFIISWCYTAMLLGFAMYETNLAEKTGLVPDSYSMHGLYNITLWAFVAVFYWRFGDRTPSNLYIVNSTSQVCATCVTMVLLCGPRWKRLMYGATAKVQVLSASYIIDFSDLEVLHQIGEGSYGDVLKGRWKQTPVALKRLRGSLSADQMRAFGSEVGTMVELHHPNCVMLMGFSVSPPVLVMEFLGRGSLYQVLHVDKTPFDWTMNLHTLVDCARGMNFLHTHAPPLIHRDLKSPNILVSSNWRCKIADFGLAQLKKAGRKGKSQTDEAEEGNGIGSLLWCAPEVLQNRAPTASSDVYAFAVIMFEVLFREVPFAESETLFSVIANVCDGVRPSSSRPPASKDDFGKTWDDIMALMRACWDQEPANRPEFSAVLTKLEDIAESLLGAHSWEQSVVYPRASEAIPRKPMRSMVDCLEEGDLEMGFKIGEGAYGEVFEGIYLNKKVAVKQLFVNGMQEEVLEEFHSEVNIMREMEHPCLVKLLGVMEKMPKLLLVTELMLKGSLWDHYHKEKVPTPHSMHMNLALNMAMDMAKGMDYLHEKSILHRDLKSQNIWLDGELKCKIGDFGMSRMNANKTMTLCGSPLWCSPEILRSERYAFPADTYSFAVILWEAFHWAEPYTELTVMEIIVSVTQRNERPEISPSVPAAIRKIICSAWHPEPKQRPTFATILSKLEAFQRDVKENPDIIE